MDPTITEVAVPAAAVAIVMYLVNIIKMMSWMPPWGPPLLAIGFGWMGLTAVRIASGQSFSPTFWAAVFIGGFLVAQAAGGSNDTSKKASREQTARKTRTRSNTARRRALAERHARRPVPPPHG